MYIMNWTVKKVLDLNELMKRVDLFFCPEVDE